MTGKKKLGKFKDSGFNHETDEGSKKVGKKWAGNSVGEQRVVQKRLYHRGKTNPRFSPKRETAG